MTQSFSTHRQSTRRLRRTFRPQAEALEGRQLLSAGALDTAFGTGGYVLAPPAGARAVQIDSSLNILAAGSTGGTNSNFQVVRLTSSGNPDTSFGSGTGSVTTDFAGQADQANAMAVLSSGQILVAGTAGDLDPRTVRGKTVNYPNADFGLVSYNADGSLATNFGSGGKVTTNISTYISTDSNNKRDEAWALAVQSDGKILVGGRTWTSSTTFEIALARYNSDGSLDASFGNGGVVLTQASNGNSSGIWGLAIQHGTTDKIIAMAATGPGTWQIMLARYNLDGSLDTSFGTDGTGTVITADPPGYFDNWSMGFQSNGDIVVGGYYVNGTSQELALARYTAQGVLDSTFGNAGIVHYDTGGNAQGLSIAIQSNDDILLAGNNYVGSSLLARFTPNGAIDPTFGNGGLSVNAFTSGESNFSAVTIQPDGKVVAVGAATTTTKKGSTTNFLIARFLGDSSTPALATVSPAVTSFPTPAGQDMQVPIPLVSTIDQDLTAVATELLRLSTKRSRSADRRAHLWIANV